MKKNRYAHLSISIPASVHRMVSGQSSAPQPPASQVDLVAHQERLRTLLDEFIEEQDGTPPTAKSNEASKDELEALPSPKQKPTDPLLCQLPDLSDEVAVDVERFLVQLAHCYQKYGCPTHIIEVNMPKVARGLGLQAYFAVFPAFLLVTVHRNHRPHTTFHVSSSGLDMYRLQLVDELVRQIASYASTEPPKNRLADLEARMAAIQSPQPSPAAGSPEAVRSPAETAAPGSVVDMGATGASLREEPTPRATNQPSMHNVDESAPAERVAALLSARAPSTAVVAPSISNATLKRLILDTASYGPGFFIPEQTATTDENPSITAVHASPKYVRRDPELRGSSRVSPVLKTTKLNEEEIRSKLTSPATTAAFEMQGNLIRFFRRRYVATFSRIAMEDGMERLDQIMKAPKLYPMYARWFFTALTSAGCAGMFFGGSWVDTLVSLFLGLLVAMIGYCNRYAQFSRIYEILCAIIVSVLARMASHFVHPICYKAVTLSSLIGLLQGITITMAIVEIMTKNLVSGTVHLFYGIVMSALMGFGLDLGNVLFAHAFGVSKEEFMAFTQCDPEGRIAVGWYPLFFIVTCASFNMLINTHYRQQLPMLFVAACGFVVSYFLKPYLGNGPTSVLAAFVTGAVSNLYSRYSYNPPIITIMSGLLLLVPGSVALTGFFQFFQQDTTGAMSLALGMLTISMALSFGLFLSSLLVSHDDTRDWFSKMDSMHLSGLTF